MIEGASLSPLEGKGGSGSYCFLLKSMSGGLPYKATGEI